MAIGAGRRGFLKMAIVGALLLIMFFMQNLMNQLDLTNGYGILHGYPCIEILQPYLRLYMEICEATAWKID